jgi:hypothetical protein
MVISWKTLEKMYDFGVAVFQEPPHIQISLIFWVNRWYFSTDQSFVMNI